jgi:ATP-dependent DNA helicase RecG
VIAANQRTIQEQLSSLRFFNHRLGCPTNAALLLFGKKPRYFFLGHYIQYLLFPGTDMTDIPIDQAEIEGDLAYMIRETELRIRSINTTALRRKSGWQEELQPDYPEWAIRELLVNALMHRDYASTTPVRFYVFSDHIEIGSPGGLYGESNPGNFPNINAYRNPVVAEALKTLGVVNRYGYGVRRAMELLAKNGNPEPVFDLSSVWVGVRVGKRAGA